MNNTFTKEDIKNMIHEIRGENIILASDLAKVFEMETKRINEIVKRNKNKFNYTFCFQLTKNEYENIYLRSQIATLNKKKIHVEII